MRSSRRAPTSFVTFVALASAVALFGAACGDDGGDSSSSSPRPTSPPATTGPPNTENRAQLGAVNVRLTPVAQLDDPTAMTTRQGDAALYITEQVGRVRALRDGQVDPQPVIDLSGEVGSGGERGLLGLAFSADGTRLYVHYTNREGHTRVDEYAMSGNTADAGSRRQLLALPQPQANHNGGELSFGPDGMLYLGLGDGGGAGDSGAGHAPGGNGQSLDTLLGKILRIDPTPSGGRQYTIPPDNPFANGGGQPEIWAFGLRNPWKFSWDRETSDLWIADVGQNEWEEIDFVAGGRAAGLNFGWNRLEGNHEFEGDPPPDAVPPIFEYPLDNACAAIGGYVYRGSQIPALVGAYVYSDFCDSAIRAIVQQGGQVTDQRDLGIQGNQVTAFGQDQNGELYVMSQGDGVQRIDPA